MFLLTRDERKKEISLLFCLSLMKKKHADDTRRDDNKKAQRKRRLESEKSEKNWNKQTKGGSFTTLPSWTRKKKKEEEKSCLSRTRKWSIWRPGGRRYRYVLLLLRNNIRCCSRWVYFISRSFVSLSLSFMCLCLRRRCNNKMRSETEISLGRILKCVWHVYSPLSLSLSL